MWPILFIVAIIAAIPTAGMSLLWLAIGYVAFKVVIWVCIFLYLVFCNKDK